MSHDDQVIDGRITRRQALVGAGTAALGVSLFGPSSLSRFSPFGATAGAATAGSPVTLLLRPDTNLDAVYPTLASWPNLKYIESFISAVDGTTSTPPGSGGVPTDPQYMAKYGSQWLAYVKAGSVFKAENAGNDPGDSLYATDALVLKDNVYNKPIIGPVTGNEYMPDLTNATFRQKVITICQKAIQTGHKGIWLDNVLNPIYSYTAQMVNPTTGALEPTMLGKPDAYGHTPMPKRADGSVITTAAWNAASAQLMTDLRAALGASVPILANVPWFAPWDEGDGNGGNFSNPSFKTVAQKATLLNREGWTYWGPNLMDGGNMDWTMSIIEGARAAVPTAAFCFDTFPSTNDDREYALAAAYLVKNEADVFADSTYYSAVDWLGYHLDLGAPSTGRVQITGKYAWTRTFASGFVAFNAETTAVTVTLPAGKTYRKLDGTTVSGSVSLAANRGLLLSLTPGPTASIAWAAPATSAATVDLSATDATLGVPRDWRAYYGSTAGLMRAKNMRPSTFTGLWTKTGTGAVATYTAATKKITWTDALGGAAAPSPTTAPLITTSSTGFLFRLNAYSAETRTLKLYVGLRGAGVNAAYAASFGGGGSATGILQGTSDTTVIDRVLTLTFKPQLPSDVLTVQWILTSNNANAQLILYGAQLF